MMKTGIAWIISASVCMASYCRAQTVVEQHGQLRVQGNHIVDKNGFPFQMRGMALYWSNGKPAFYNANCIRWLRDDWRCTVVRPSMGVRTLGGTAGYMGGPAAALAEKNKVKAVVQAAIDLGVYVVIDWHETGNGNDYLDSAKSFFADMARTYGQYPNVIYELWNEPTNMHAWATVIKPYHQAIIPVIRAIDPDNLILCGSKSWDQDVDEASLSPVTVSTNLIYTLHFYAATHKQSYRDKAKTALTNGLALMATEAGLSTANGNGTIDTAEMRRWVNFMDSNSISWMNWSVADLTETSAALKPGASGDGNWTAAQLSPSGTWVRNELRGKNAAVSALTSPSRFSPARTGSLYGSLTILRGTTSLTRDASILDLRGREVNMGRNIAIPAGGHTPAAGSYVFRR